MTAATHLPPLLERFFTQRLMQERRVSPHTISSYRDTFRLFLKFTQQRLHKPPSALAFEEIDAPLIVAFLYHLEKRRGLSVRSRNLRLTAIRSFFRYLAFELPTHSAQIQRVLAILMAVQTGLRLSEITGATREDLLIGSGAHVRVVGKGRKERCIPLAKPTVAVLKAWLQEPSKGDGHLLFPNTKGERLSVHGVKYMLNRHAATAARVCTSLADKRVTVHVLRHTMALEMLQAGVDRAVIALWLGHESVETTQMYLEATLTMKEQALAKTTAPQSSPGRFLPDDRLLGFLNSL
jgi:site-specific recombinase XerD